MELMTLGALQGRGELRWGREAATKGCVTELQMVGNLRFHHHGGLWEPAYHTCLRVTTHEG